MGDVDQSLQLLIIGIRLIELLKLLHHLYNGSISQLLKLPLIFELDFCRAITTLINTDDIILGRNLYLLNLALLLRDN